MVTDKKMGRINSEFPNIATSSVVYITNTAFLKIK